jgi:hypothetical protein
MRSASTVLSLLAVAAFLWSCKADQVVAPKLTFPVGQYVGHHEWQTVEADDIAPVLSQPIRFEFGADGTFLYSRIPMEDDSSAILCDVLGEYSVKSSGIELTRIDSNFTRGICNTRSISLSGLWTVDTSGVNMTLYRRDYDPGTEVETYQWLRLNRGR